MTPARPGWSHLLLLSVALLPFPRETRAQGWFVDASVGQIAQPSIPGSAASTGAALGLRYDGVPWLYLTGGVPFDSAGQTWGAIGVGGRLATGGRSFAGGVDGAAHGHGYRDRSFGASGGGATLEAMPLVALTAGAARVELRSGVQHHATGYASSVVSRTVFPTEIRGSFGGPLLRANAEARLVRAPEESYPYVGGGVEAAVGGASVWGFGGRWLSELIETPVWGGGVRLGVVGTSELFASVQQETNDPLFRNAPRRSWSVGVSHRFGAVRGAAPVVPPPVRVSAGTTFRVPAALYPTAPSIAGDFTGWKPVVMQREGEFWATTLPVARGSHRYAFRDADGEWFVPIGTPGRSDDGFGGVVAVVVVP